MRVHHLVRVTRCARKQSFRVEQLRRRTNANTSLRPTSSVRGRPSRSSRGAPGRQSSRSRLRERHPTAQASPPDRSRRPHRPTAARWRVDHWSAPPPTPSRRAARGIQTLRAKGRAAADRAGGRLLGLAELAQDLSERVDHLVGGDAAAREPSFRLNSFAGSRKRARNASTDRPSLGRFVAQLRGRAQADQDSGERHPTARASPPDRSRPASTARLFASAVRPPGRAPLPTAPHHRRESPDDSESDRPRGSRPRTRPAT